jgi:KaiC/GvpD/RAD55 family RecA-like ATPase
LSSNKEKITLKTLLHFLLLLMCVFFKAQEKEYWLIDLQTNKKTIVKDSISAVQFLDSLTQNYYYFTEVKEVCKEGDITQIIYDKGKNFNKTQVKLDNETVQNFKYQPEFYTKNLDSLKNDISEKYRSKGYVFNRVKSQFKGMKSDIPQVELTVIKSEQRTIDEIVFKGYEKVPQRFVRNLEQEYLGKKYQENTLTKLNRALYNHPFLLLDKPPQTLYTKATTSIYLFSQKKKSNSFDGIIGFGNDKTEKFTFNGSLNLNFRNMFNGFETISLLWQRNPDKGQIFDVQSDIPYLFKSNIGGNFKLNIFRQDSTYANVKLTPGFYLHLRSNQKIGLRGTFETSTVLDSLYVQGKDYDKKGIGLWYEYSEPSEVELFLYKTKIRVEADYITSNYSAEHITAKQTNLYILGEKNFHIIGNNYINLRGETALLHTKNNFAVNELLRFGGWNSFRGFSENSMYADFFYYATAEYRYLVGNQAFFDVFTQYGKLQNKNLEVKPKLISFGLGFHFTLPIGLMSFQISNGNEIGNAIKFGDTKIHWGILSRF